MITSLKIRHKKQEGSSVDVITQTVLPGWVNVVAEESGTVRSPFDISVVDTSVVISYSFGKLQYADISSLYPIQAYFNSLTNPDGYDHQEDIIPYVTTISGVGANARGNIMILGSDTTNVDYRQSGYTITDMAQTPQYTILFNVVHDMLRQIRLWLDAHKDNLLLPNPDVEEALVPASVYMWNKMLTMEDSSSSSQPVTTTTKLYEGCTNPSYTEGPLCAMPHFRETRQRSSVIPKSTNLLNEYKSLVFIWNSVVSRPIVQIKMVQHPEDPAGLYAIVVCSFMYPMSWYNSTQSESTPKGVVLEVRVSPSYSLPTDSIKRWETIVGYGSNKIGNDGISFAPDFNIPVEIEVSGTAVAQSTMEGPGYIGPAGGTTVYKVNLEKSPMPSPVEESSYGSFAIVISDIPFSKKEESDSSDSEEYAPEVYYASKYNSKMISGSHIRWHVSAKLSYPNDPYFDESFAEANPEMDWYTNYPKQIK